MIFGPTRRPVRGIGPPVGSSAAVSHAKLDQDFTPDEGGQCLLTFPRRARRLSKSSRRYSRRMPRIASVSGAKYSLIACTAARLISIQRFDTLTFQITSINLRDELISILTRIYRHVRNSISRQISAAQAEMSRRPFSQICIDRIRSFPWIDHLRG